ncbi:leucine--tRNA ligase [Candidatus Woesearchaeota archaeon]|nr:leucine--tRNA ligase [Candidatus Woesearchaeota archaeon]
MVDYAGIERKWQQRWAAKKLFKAADKSKKPKFYCLEMFPYPSSTLLHIGHVRNYTIGDVIARFKRMRGCNVLYPMGYDSFGLPAENAAKKEGIHPRQYTDGAIKKIMEYQKALGNSYDWDRTIATHEPQYYRWNQYFFLKFLEKGLVYRKKAPVNWCPSCRSVLANEEVVDGCCWRHEDTLVEARELDQWFLKTTAYAEQLLDGLQKLQWSDRIKLLQRNWIGKSEGVLIDFAVKGSRSKLQVFTTRPDTIFGVTFVVVSPKHALIDVLAKDKEAVRAFAKKMQTDEEKGKEGLLLGTYAINPFTNEEVPIYAANFVVAEYGTGAVMAVPAHDTRDFDFAKKYGLPVKTVIQPEGQPQFKAMEAAYVDEGTLCNSGQFSGLRSSAAIMKITEFAEKNRYGKRTVQYKLRDWLISRQRYWGTPIPIVYCDNCGMLPVPEKNLPVLLPDKVDFKVEGNPLAAVKDWVNTKCSKCKGPAKRETDTMGGFVDSSWYFLRYCSPKAKTAFDRKTADYWMPVDQYIGGIEHAVGHLLYSRFWTKALRDLGMISVDEPFTRLFNQGIVYKDGHKMSKSFGNIVTQTEISSKYGIDTARLYVISVADPESDMEWSDAGVEGVFRLVNKVFTLYQEPYECDKRDKDAAVQHKLNQAVLHVTAELHRFKLQTAVQHLMDVVHYLHKWKGSISTKVYNNALKTLCALCSPFMPHIAEECWELLKQKGFVSIAKWPVADAKKIDPYFDNAEELIEQTLSDVRDIMRLVKIEKCSRITLFAAEQWKHEFYAAMKAQLAKTKNTGEIIRALMATGLREHGSDIAKLVPKLVQDPSRILAYSLNHADEAKALQEGKLALEKELGCAVEIIAAEKSKEQKARNAWPGKPAIVVM